MTKKDFIAIARGINTIHDDERRKQYALAIIDELAADNERFDSVRFLTACRVAV